MLLVRQLPSLGELGRYNSRLVQIGLMAGSFASLLAYFVATEWNPFELVRVLGGLVALWAPAGALIYLLLRTQVPDGLTRFTFSSIASYALTSVAYFGAAVLNIIPAFYAASIAATLVVGGWWLVARKRQPPATDHVPLAQRIDWVLVALIAASLLVNIRYQTAYSVSPSTGDRTFRLDGDQTYYAGLVYELERHTPPLQQTIKAGVPDRAYHLLPHLTTMLVARFTGQGDALRAHLIYEYPVIEILMCLVFYSIVKMLTRSRWGGYIGVAILYIFALPMSPSLKDAPPFFYFTSYPYVSSELEPVVMTSPQMYSGLLVFYGILLGVLLMSSRIYNKERASTLVIVCALLVSAMLRFRVQIYIPLVVGFLLLACYGLWRTRHRVYFAGIVTVFVISALLYLEMRSPVYLLDSTKFSIGNNGLSLSPGLSWINSWPYAGAVNTWLTNTLRDPKAFSWAWQIVSLTLFVLANMLGIPLIIATFMYLRSGSALRDWKLYTFLSLWMVVGSLAGAMLIKGSYDSYSVGGQMLLHTGWYLFPLMGVGVWFVLRFLRKRVSWSRQTWGAIAAAVVMLALTIQQVRPSSALEAYTPMKGTLVLSPNDWSALQYIHNSTPDDSVIISNKHLESLFGVFGGIGGRAAYYEYTITSLSGLTASAGGQEDRPGRINALWSASTAEEFCALLLPTVATHLVEYSGSPLVARNPPCLQKVWAANDAPGEKVTIWHVEHPGAASMLPLR